MKTINFRFADNEYWSAQITINSNLFFEADRLDAAAYALISHGFNSPDVWRRFAEAKTVERAQRKVAYQDWIRIRRALEE